MGRKQGLSGFEKGQTLAFHNLGISCREIASRLGRDHKTIATYLATRGKPREIWKSGRKPKLSPRDKRLILKEASNKSITLSQIRFNLKLPVSNKTIGRVIAKSPNIRRQKLKRKPPLTAAHKAQRMDWAKKYIGLGEKWHNIIWSDEKKFNLDGPDGYAYYWHDLRKEDRYFKGRHTGGGSVMVWGAFSGVGCTPLAIISGSLNYAKYLDILQDLMAPHFRVLTGGNGYFQQDNARPHVARVVKDWFRHSGFPLLDHPPYSPDLNPIENLWGILVRSVYRDGKQYDDVESLKTAILQAWEDIDPLTLVSLAESMKERAAAVLIAKGGSTKY